MHPGFVCGPTLIGERNSTAEGIAKFMRGEVPGVPKIMMGIVDVRDVAEAHYLAFIKDGLSGRRFIII